VCSATDPGGTRAAADAIVFAVWPMLESLERPSLPSEEQPARSYVRSGRSGPSATHRGSGNSPSGESSSW